MAMQIVRNLQIRIQSIHIRYEDDETNPDKNFAIGAVLSKLTILTTNNDWVPRYQTDNAGTVYKLLNMEGFALYWDCNSVMISKQETEMDRRVQKLKDILHTSKFDNCMYIKKSKV